MSNIGYVFATCAALSGFLLLRKDRPNWPRPVHLSSIWVPLGAVLLTANVVFLIAGGFIYSGGFLGIEGYGYGWDKTRWGLLVLLLAFVLYVVPARRPGQAADPLARGGAGDPGGADGASGARAGDHRGDAGLIRIGDGALRGPVALLGWCAVRVLALADKRPPLDPAMMAEQIGADAVVSLGDLDRAWIEPLAQLRDPARRRARQPRRARPAARGRRAWTCTASGRRWAG